MPSLRSLEVSGATDADVYAKSSLEANVSRAGTIIYSGSPSDVSTDVSGAADIRPRH